jgi:hypothetical protein
MLFFSGLNVKQTEPFVEIDRYFIEETLKPKNVSIVLPRNVNPRYKRSNSTWRILDVLEIRDQERYDGRYRQGFGHV